MAEQQHEAARPAAAGTASALSELMAGAKALQAIQAQAAMEAGQLPNPRLDDGAATAAAQGGTYYHLRDNGDGTLTPIDPNGNVLGPEVRPGEPVHITPAKK